MSVTGVGDAKAGVHSGVKTVNRVQAYLVDWWGSEGSEISRPTFGVLDIDNGYLLIRHAILEGRPLGDYTLPYWPIRSFLSIVAGGLELAHLSSARFSVDNQADTVAFRCGDEKYSHSRLGAKRISEGFDLTEFHQADVLMVSNRGSDSPVRMEYILVIPKEDSALTIIARATNVIAAKLQNVVIQTRYRQDFIWDQYLAGADPLPRSLTNLGEANDFAFAVFSSGMQRGFRFHCLQNCRLSYFLRDSLNAWQVSIENEPKDLSPGESITYQYLLAVTNTPSPQPTASAPFTREQLDSLQFRRVAPKMTKTAPPVPARRPTLADVLVRLKEPKVRGLNLLGSFTQLQQDLDTLKAWGGNLAILSSMNAEEAKQIIARGHSLNMQMFLTGDGSFRHGAPAFDRFFSAGPKTNELPEAYGQDEDHYYWYGVEPSLDLQSVLGNSLPQPTVDDEVIYWSRCFVDKWRQVLSGIRRYHPSGQIWFYTPTPGLAHVDPLDYYDPFFREVAQLGDQLTVFPFYYGIDYLQVEYMIRRWKEAGLRRVVFLPMRGSMIKPSQFVRAITAARRGGADGTCGFAFPVSGEQADQNWQWQSVMLAAQANFPTPELDAFCLIEEPAELIEALTFSSVDVVSQNYDARNLIQNLAALLPHPVRQADRLPSKMPSNRISLVIDERRSAQREEFKQLGLADENFISNKGLLSMEGQVVYIAGTDAVGMSNAIEFLLRFAALARAEAEK